jgi:quercetin dioxygenase-like cupin family protein
LVVCANTVAQTPKTDSIKTKNEEVTIQSIKWGWLNQLRGDKSPAAGQLWGDRTDTLASGFLVKFNKGFSSPPHIHNVTYRGVVIKGLLHNDDENAEKQWLPAGSFWIQPAGEAHITSANAKDNLAYIEIQEGPYLVKPTDEAFDNGERPVNVDKNNLVWLNVNDITWITDDSNVQTAFLWG